MPWGAVAGAVIGAWGANQQSKAAKDAAKAQGAASDKSSQVQMDMFNRSRQDMEPWRQAGMVGLNEYMALMGLPTQSLQASAGGSGQGWGEGGMMPQFTAEAAKAYLAANPDVAASSAFGNNPLAAWEHYKQYGRSEGRAWGTPQQSTASTATGTANTAQAQQAAFNRFRSQPGYQFGLDEGLKATQASAAAHGGLNSGATLKSLMKLGRDYSDQQGYTPYMNRLASLSGIGQTTTNQIAGLGQNVASQVGANTINAGQARAQGIYDKTNAWSNWGAQAANALGQADWSKFGWGGV